MINQLTAGKSRTQSKIFDPHLFPAHSAGTVNSGRTVFLFGVSSYALVDIWLLRWVPLGFDDGHFWQLFYASYTEVFYHRELAHWFPYGAY